MKNIKSFVFLFLLALVFSPLGIKAEALDYQIVDLKTGWNVVSTPKILSSYEFSVPETSSNFDIYLLDPSSPSGWQTMQGVGQDKFTPLFAYFINNKTGQEQTLRFNYDFNLTPSQRLFQRTLNSGWNAIGIANPGYALGQNAPTNLDTNNPANILNSISGSVGQVVDFTDGNINPDSASISNNWLSKNISDVNSLKDFRELKAYGVFINNTTVNFLGSQNLTIPDPVLPVITLIGDANIEVFKNDTYIDAGATAFDNIDGDITNNIIVTNNVNTSVVGTYQVKYNVVDSVGNNAVEVVRTVIVKSQPGFLTLTKNSTYANQSFSLPATAFKIGSWNLINSPDEDMLLTTLSFNLNEVLGNSFNQSDLTNMYVVVKNGATVVAQPSPLATVSVTDNNFSLNYTLAKNASVSIELFANLGTSVDIGDSFNTDLSISGTAMVSGNVVVTSGITGQTITSSLATITATIDSSTPVSAILFDNQTITASAFKFSSENAGFNIEDLTFNLADATTAQSIELYDGATLIASRPGASTVTFNGLSWNIPANSNRILAVKLVLGSVGVGAGTSGASQLITLKNFTAVNTSSGVSSVDTEANPSGNPMYVYAATPTINNATLPTSVLTIGTTSIAKFSVASNGGTIGWKKIVFNVNRSISGPDTLSNTVLYDADTNTQIAGTVTYSDGIEADNGTSGTIIFVTTNEQQVSGTKTYELRTNIAGTLTEGNYITTNIPQPSNYMAPANYSPVANTDTSFVWTDMSASSHSESTSDWNNSFLVRNLPTSTQVLSKQ
ncbi:MAG: immunoglobulin-like domain-containing protein [Candidatus Paceibacterota bacterium]